MPVTGVVATAGVTFNHKEVAAFTCKVAVAGDNGLAAYVALIVEAPTAVPVAIPVDAPIVATTAPPKGRLVALQVETDVLSKLVPSLKVSIAENF